MWWSLRCMPVSHNPYWNLINSKDLKFYFIFFLCYDTTVLLTLDRESPSLYTNSLENILHCRQSVIHNYPTVHHPETTGCRTSPYHLIPSLRWGLWCYNLHWWHHLGPPEGVISKRLNWQQTFTLLLKMYKKALIMVLQIDNEFYQKSIF